MPFQDPLSEPTDYIEQSWKRCRDIGLKQSEKADDQLLTGTSIKELQSRYDFLFPHAEAVFEKLYPLIIQSGSVVFLTDPEGTILYASGDAAFASRAARVQLQVGANWHETKKGTNAIGVAIEEKRPALVKGSQHFFRENHFLTCASAPIFDRAGELLGVVNISGLKETFHPVLASAASLAADVFQNRMLVQEMRAEHLITLQQLETIRERHPLPLLTLDGDRRITGANPSAMRLLGNCLGAELPSDLNFQIITLKDDTHKLYRSVAIKESPATSASSRQQPPLYTFSDIFGSCPAIVQVKELAKKASCSQLPVLLTGESGTGKELFAQAIHTQSERGPFVAVNCSAIPDTLIESELFGYEKGAFTGANREGGIGKFQAADGGTLFLDEIGDMSVRAQAALLRVLQEKTVTPVGSVKSRRVDVRIIAATHRNLFEEVQAGRFRADLFYRLKGITIRLPALRQRKDIRQLAEHLLKKHAEQPKTLSPAVLQLLERHPWPGNIRELLSVLLQASFLAEGGVIEAEHIVVDTPWDRQEEGTFSLRENERKTIEEVLQETNGNIARAASLLNIGRNTLYRKIRGYGIQYKKSPGRMQQ
ncbi:sigma-54-dependent Fis family transcriptional regulator [Brevibacillus sp. B_LB10_24]|uniref:sigma-54-dependent Fis family transcriptional regulator n=1 Tax=Brevibacillus sp. B_LB10_24 TaxID=3380645 RepID=UPI0038BBD3A3